MPVIGDWVAVTDGFVNAQIQPQVSGYLIKQDYVEGGLVHAGQVLFEIDPRPLDAILGQAKGQLEQSKSQVIQAQAQLAQAQAQYELAGINVTRDTPLAKEHAIAQSTLDNETKTQQANAASVNSAKAAIVTAQSAVVSSQASVDAAELNVGFTKVRSLIDGIAGQAALQVGNLVSQSSVLTSVSKVNPIKVFFSIGEPEYLALAARVKSAGKSDLLNSGNLIPLKLTLANNQVFPQVGHIIFVDRSVSAQTGSLRIAASFANPNNLLRPGQFARVSAKTDTLSNAVIVPQRAVNELQGQNQVAVVGAGDAVHIQNVKLGTQIGPDIVILEGLKGDERVVVEGNDKLKEGMKVMPQTAPSSSAGN